MKRKLFHISTGLVSLIVIGILTLGNMVDLSAFASPTSTHVQTPPTVDELKREHPRVMLTSADVTRIKTSIETDPAMKQWYDKLITDANIVIGERTAWYDIPDGIRLLEMSRTVLRRMFTLGMAYQLTGEQKYVDRAWKDLESAAGQNANIPFPNWNTSHFLDTAEMTNAFAVGYDWMYAAWTPAQRDTIRNAIITRGLNEGLNVYSGDKTGPANRWFWAGATNNWNIVCNSGLATGAMAIGEEATDISNAILQHSYQNIQQGLAEIHEDGSYSEGLGYWGYATSYAVYYLAGLLTTTDSDHGLIASIPGLAKTGDFPLYLNGPKVAFNYGDTGNGRVAGTQLFWLGAYFNKPLYTTYQKSLGGGDAKSLLWYKTGQGSSTELPLDGYFPVANLASMRSSWTDANGLFVGFKAGSNQDGHNDLDLGTFVLDAQGTRWAEELGQENYNSPGYWETGESGRRWNYYRKRAEGQNTLVINPGLSADQYPLAKTNITTFTANANEALSIMDLTAAYAKDATSVKRGIRTLDQRRQILIQDEIQNKTASDIWWFMHTRATIQVAPDGKTAILTLNKKRLWARLVTPGEGSFSVMDAVPLPTSPQVTNTANTGVRKLTVHLPNTTNTTIAVQLVPLLDGENPPTTTPLQLKPLSDWKLSPIPVHTLKNIQVNGQALADFRTDRFSYNIVLPVETKTAPKITATATSRRDKVEIKTTPGLPGTARICVNKLTCYTVSYRVAVWIGPLSDAPKLPVSAVSASANDGNIPENTLDNNFNTRWSADGDGQWIRYDLGSEQTVGLLGIGFFNGNQRFTTFDIEVSNDATTWTKVFSGASSSETNAEEIFDFNDVSARYVRIVGHGNSANTFNSITEVIIYGARN